ncbi:MAG: hypothetical protein K0R48_232 [Gammaproteobacteria bacterium]|jgi:hypothetical protein|nr:hypothetical protein [Gammaproteobacteria bacterium]
MKNFYGVLQNGALIPSAVSRKLLDGIINDRYDEKLLSIYNITLKKIKNLRRLYEAKREIVHAKQPLPRHFIFYTILADKMPQISWKIKSYNDNKIKVNFKLPLIDNLQPSLMSLLLDRVQICTNQSRLQYGCTRTLQSDVRNALENFLHDADVIMPSEEGMHQIVNWINNARANMPSTIFIHTCPDYAVEPTFDVKRPYKHTFTSLGCEIGQIAKRIINILPSLKVFLERIQVKTTIITTIADYEAFSEKTVKRVGLSKEQFLYRVNLSRLAFQEESNQVIPIETFMCADLCGGEKLWLQQTKDIHAEFDKDYFGKPKISNGVFLDIAKRRKALYSRWYNEKDISAEHYVPIAKSQAAEYAMIGSFLAKNFVNCLVLGADDILFSPFYSFYKIIPVIYFKRRYY